MKPLSKGPKVLVAVLAVIYAVFVLWYGGNGKPMTPQEKDELFARITESAKTGGAADPHAREALLRLAATDDGKEFFMINLIRFRAKAAYPAGYDYGDDALEADARYNEAVVPALIKHGSIPVFLGTPEGPFLTEAGDTEWQRVAIVRYRSRRDLLEMCVDLAGNNSAVHKWAAIEKTQVFPASSPFNLFFVRGLMAVLIGIIGLLAHWGLSRTVWYRK